MTENKDTMDVMDTEPKTKDNEPENEPENAKDSQKETLQVFKKASRSKKVRTGIIVALGTLTGFVVGRLTGKVKEPTETEEVIDVEPDETEETTD